MNKCIGSAVHALAVHIACTVYFQCIYAYSASFELTCVHKQIDILVRNTHFTVYIYIYI